MPFGRWSVGPCCGCDQPTCSATIHIREGCTPFAAISGVSVAVYAASSGGTAIDSGTTDGSGDVVVDLPGGTAVYWVEASKSGCASSPRREVTLSCGGTTNLSLWCSTGKHAITVNKCCSGGGFTGILTVTKGGVTVAEGPGPTLTFPKSAGTGAYSVAIPTVGGCQGGSVTVNVSGVTLCTNTSSTVTLTALAGRTCCNGVAMPNGVKFIDGLGVHASTTWSKTAAGSRSRVNQSYATTEAEWHNQNILSPECETPGCTDAWTLWELEEYAPNTATTEVSYSLSCITGGFRLTAVWLYRQATAREGQGDICRLCGGSCTGICSGGTAPDCATGWPMGDPVDVSYDGSLCQHDWPAPEWWHTNTYAPASPIGTWTTASATADWIGTISDPDSFSMTFTFSDPGWTFDGPRSSSPTPPTIQPPPPPGGITVTVTNP